jgi:hypothetical protein
VTAIDKRKRKGWLCRKVAGGDTYAGSNGNVYKRDNGQWYQHENGSWNAMDKSNWRHDNRPRLAILATELASVRKMPI